MNLHLHRGHHGLQDRRKWKLKKSEVGENKQNSFSESTWKMLKDARKWSVCVRELGLLRIHTFLWNLTEDIGFMTDWQRPRPLPVTTFHFLRHACLACVARLVEQSCSLFLPRHEQSEVNTMAPILGLCPAWGSLVISCPALSKFFDVLPTVFSNECSTSSLSSNIKIQLLKFIFWVNHTGSELKTPIEAHLSGIAVRNEQRIPN